MPDLRPTASPPPPRRLNTTVPGLVLEELTVADAPAYYRVLDRNRAHLSRYGDYREEADATPAWATDHLSRPAPDRFGIWLGRHLIGRVDLVHAAPPRYGLGYWLSRDAVGHGYATAACTALIDYARVRRGATDVLAGVTHGNHPSVALLRRLGFRPVADFDTYTRFHLGLGPGVRMAAESFTVNGPDPDGPGPGPVTSSPTRATAPARCAATCAAVASPTPSWNAHASRNTAATADRESAGQPR